MINAKRTVLTVSLTAVFSTAAWADNQQLAGRVALSDDNHAQQAAEEVRKINAAYFSGSLNIPIDLQVKGYQPEINQSYDLQSNSNYVLPVSGSLNATDWQIDDSYALENGHYLDKVFQQDTDTVLLAENTVTDTATDANSGSLKESTVNSNEIATRPADARNDSNVSGSLNEDNTPIAETANTANATELESITVTGQRNQSPTDTHKSTLNRNRLTKTATNNGDIGSALKMLPNVRFDNSNGGSMSAGEISPSKISISGSQPYQNAFTIDGIGFNNDLNPGYENNAQNPGQLKNVANGRAQALALDVNMLEKIEVYDSNIPIYAPSGVAWINTEIRRPNKDFGFEIKHRYTNGSVAKGFPNSLTKYHVDEDKTREELLNRDGNVYTYYDTPEFQKHKTTITVEGRPTEKLGIIGQFQKFESRMPIQLNTVDITGGTGYKAPTPYDTPNNFGQRREKKETQYNATVKAFYDVSDDLNLDFTYIYSPDYYKTFMAGSDGSYYTKDHGGHAFGQTTKWNNSWGNLKNTLSFSRYEDSKTAHNYSDIYRFAMISDNSHWGREEEGNVIGGPVPSKSTQTSFTESLQQDFKPFKLGKTEHSISAGLDFTFQKAKFGYVSPNFWREDTNNAVPMTEEEMQKCIAGNDYRFCDPSRTYDVGWLGVGSKGFLPTNPMFETEEYINPWTGKPVGATTASYLKKGALADKMLIWKYGNYVQKIRHYDGTRKVNINNKKFDIWVQDKIEWPLGDNSRYGQLTFTPCFKIRLGRLK
ncbi:MAG: TonB-dependent receptor plug domain-containing protein [Neisseriaceae bacterium]|nr:TonB-dependent receptor plug domain-containing protein [Neisseriaceae bacterium]